MYRNLQPGFPTCGAGVSDRILRGKNLTIATGGTMPRGGIRYLRRCLDKFISPGMDSGLIIRLHISRAVGLDVS